MDMDNEEKIIRLVSQALPGLNKRISRPFESDAEIFLLDNNKYLWTIDEFSSEDLLYFDNPAILGWNVAVGTLSDIFASGGIPVFYGHSMVLSPQWDEKFVKRFCEGIGEALNECKCAFLGGDIGCSNDWRYTASVIGALFNKKPMTRRGARPGDSIYLTGKIGLGNVGAAISILGNEVKKDIFCLRFPLRFKESRFIRDYASSCTDTSDGVFQGLNFLAGINDLGYEIENLPYCKQGIMLCESLKLPDILLFLGESGEYELLFTVNPECEKVFLKNAEKQGLSFYFLGKMSSSGKTKIIKRENKPLNLHPLKIRARDFQTPLEYLRKLTAFLKGGYQT